MNMRRKPSSKRTPRLGQHFLTGQWAAVKLAECIGVRPEETILEIGPGKGALTKELLKTGSRVIAVEKDTRLVQHLQETFPENIASGTLRVVSSDIRDISPEKLNLNTYVLAANIPYYITGEIIRSFLTAKQQPRALALLVQKEVAERILGARRLSAGRQGKESILSISVKAYGTPRIVAKVSRGNFSPPPSVDSAILLIDNVSRDFFLDVDEKTFFRVVRSGFASKRKLLAGNLSAKFGFTKPEILGFLAKCGVPEYARAEDVPLETWKCLATHLGTSISRESA